MLLQDALREDLLITKAIENLENQHEILSYASKKKLFEDLTSATLNPIGS